MIRLFIYVLMISGRPLRSPSALCALVDAARRFMQRGLLLFGSALHRLCAGLLMHDLAIS
jgi:hypothetical protein